MWPVSSTSSSSSSWTRWWNWIKLIAIRTHHISFPFDRRWCFGAMSKIYTSYQLSMISLGRRWRKNAIRHPLGSGYHLSSADRQHQQRAVDWLNQPNRLLSEWITFYCSIAQFTGIDRGAAVSSLKSRIRLTFAAYDVCDGYVNKLCVWAQLIIMIVGLPSNWTSCSAPPCPVVDDK